MRQKIALQIKHTIKKIDSDENGESFKISLRIPLSMGWIENVYFSVFDIKKKLKHQKNENYCAYFETDIELNFKALYHYFFSFEANSKTYYYTKSNLSMDSNFTKHDCWKLSVGFDTPDWAKGATMYHIFVDRFCKSKHTDIPLIPNRNIYKKWNTPPIIGPNKNGEWNIDFYGGNLKGIEEKIKYIKNLGVDIIYLSPIFKSQSNHRYDTADYEIIDPYAGNIQDLINLCKTAHKNNMYVILDGVYNHTGNDSKYFNEFGNYDTIGAFQGSDSPYYSFYRRTGDNFCYWWNMKNLPVCDGYSKTWQEYIYGKNGIIDKWFSYGIDGLRLDVADELTDEFIEGIAKAVKRNKPDGLIIGEVWKNPMRMNRDYLRSGMGMHSVMNYLLADALIRYYNYCDISKLYSVLNEIMTEYPDPTIQTLMNFTSTHDISRAIEIFGSNAFEEHSEWCWNLRNTDFKWIESHQLTTKQYIEGKLKLKSYVFALTFLPGILSIFYGDEVGLQGIGNLANRAPYPWDYKDKDLLKFFKSAGEIRKNEAFLKKANFKILDITNEYFSFERYDNSNRIVIFVSRVNYPVKLNLYKDYSNFIIIFKMKQCSKNMLSSYGAIALKK